MKVFNAKTAVRKPSNPNGTSQIFADEGMNLGDVTEMKVNPSSMKTYPNQPNVVSLGGLGATDGNGNPITLDMAGNDIPNYSDGYPMTDAFGSPLPDPLVTMLPTSGTPLAPLTAPLTTPTTGSAASLVANFLTSLLPASITGIAKPGAPGAVVAAKPAGLIGGMSATTLGILGLGGLLAFKLLGKKKR
jgi:hypothetical protein